ncbi:MAG: AIR synthase family protein [Lachnospiraceae bacterium]|nr:AIR synthase family protein [Lachnospiraceae bacterium]
MKIGKVPENVLKRSILKQIKTKRPEVLVGAGVGEDCAAIALEPDEVMVLSTDPITGTTQDIGRWAVMVSANDIASSGAEVIGMLVCAMLPPDITEPEIREVMEQIETSCEELHIQVVGGHTEITDAVTRPVLTFTGIGKVKKDRLLATKGARPGQDVVVTKWVGLEGTSILAKEREQMLLEKFPRHLIDEAKAYEQMMSVVPEAAIAVKSNVSAMHDITEGGVFGALWEMAESAGVGLTIDLKKLPIKQATVEICNFFDINPYEMMSSGSMLIAADNGHDLVRELEKANIHGVVVGKVTDGNDRIVVNGDETRFLEPPKTDELYKALQKQAEWSQK